MLTRYPDFTDNEIDTHLSNVQDDGNRNICKAIVGRISPEELTEEDREIYNDAIRWSDERTNRFRNEQHAARRRERPTHEASRLMDLNQKGLVSDETMLMYGIQGDLPEWNHYYTLSPEEKRAIFEDRMEDRFGENWRDHLGHLPFFNKTRTWSESTFEWKVEGF